MNGCYEKILLEVERAIKTQKIRSVAHDISHIKRVQRIAHEIAKKEGADTKIVDLASLLHDIYRPEGKAHTKISMNMAKKILKKYDLSDRETRKILNIIGEHSLSSPTKPPSSLESLCVFEADKIDGLGAIGIMRIFQTAGQNNWDLSKTIDFFIENYFIQHKKIHLKHTEEGKKIASERLKFLLLFLNELFEELEMSGTPLKNDATKAVKEVANVIFTKTLR